jgi:hypothetical protein
MKPLICLLFVTILFSCKKNNNDTILTPDKTGVLYGSIKAYDRYGNENVNYNDVSIKLVDKEKKLVTGLVQPNGKFVFDNVPMGDVVLTISKPGYGFTDSVMYHHQNVADTISSIYLIEELPFACNLNSVQYTSGFLTISGSYNYQSTDNYLVSEYLCFSKEPQVSVNHTKLLWSPSAHTNVQYISGTLGGSTSMAFNTLTNAGFKEGDTLYVTLINSIGKFWAAYYDENKNYTVLHYKVGSGSNIVSFKLQQ